MRSDEASGAPNDSNTGGERPEEPVENLLEESDIYKVDNDRMYIINRFRGLVVADISDRDHPTILGRLAMPATPREMWVKDGRAYIVAAEQEEWGWGWGRSVADVDTWADWSGSALLVVDAVDPAAPTLTAGLRLSGDCFDGRLTGTHLLLACQPPMYGYYNETSKPAHVYSIDVSDPSRPQVVTDLMAGTNSAYGGQHIHVSPTMIYLSEPAADGTEIRLVDITNPAEIRMRGMVQVTGSVIDRFAMDEWQGHLRVAADEGNGTVHVYTISVADPDQPQLVGNGTLNVNERIMSARFDGRRGYVVTFRNIDPLFVFDLSQPAQPKLLGELEMTGWLDFMVPVGDRIVAMGHEDVDEGRGLWGRLTRRTLAVSLIDVGEGGPRLIKRVVLDGRWGQIPAERDDYNKLFRVMPAEGLVLFPYRTFSKSGYAQTAGMLLIDWKNDSLEQRADLQDIGLVERGILLDETTLATLSVQSLQIFDIADRGAPRLRGSVDLARQVTGFVRLDDQYAVEVSGDIGAGLARLIVRDMREASLETKLSDIEMDAPMGRIYRSGTNVVFVGIHRPGGYSYWYFDDEEEPEPEPKTTITVVDYADPANPVIRSSLELDGEYLQGGSSSYYYGNTRNRGAALVGGNKLVLQRASHYEPRQTAGCTHYDTIPAKVAVVDLTDVAHPRQTFTKELDIDPSNLYAGADKVFSVAYSEVQILDLSDVNKPSLGAKISGESIQTVSAAKELFVGYEYDRNNYERGWIKTFRANGRKLEEAASVGAPYPNNMIAIDDLLVVLSRDEMQTWTLSDNEIKLDGAARLYSKPSAGYYSYYEDSYAGLFDLGDGVAVTQTARHLGFYDLRNRAQPVYRMRVRVAGVSDAAERVGESVLVAGGYRGLLFAPLNPEL